MVRPKDTRPEHDQRTSPVSDHRESPDWWLASDGQWYPPQEPLIDAIAVAPTQPSISGGLSGTLQGFLWASGALSLLVALASLAAVASYSEWRDASPGSDEKIRAFRDLTDADNAISASYGMWWLSALVVFILMIIWVNQAHKASQTLWDGARAWSSGWTVGGWFVPVANAIIPKLVITEIERIGQAPRIPSGHVADGWQSHRPSALGTLWWIMFVAGTLLGSIGAIGYDSSDAADWEWGYWLLAAGHAVLTASAVLGALYVRRVSRTVSSCTTIHVAST
jgi:hypothetical protein